MESDTVTSYVKIQNTTVIRTSYQVEDILLHHFATLLVAARLDTPKVTLVNECNGWVKVVVEPFHRQDAPTLARLRSELQGVHLP